MAADQERNKRELLAYLEGWRKLAGERSVAGLLLREGHYFTPAPRPEGVSKGPNRECFRNAALLALDGSRPDLIYCEGYAVPQAVPVPLLHAWCVTAKGEVVDPTWLDPEECEYAGIAFSTRFLRRYLRSARVWGILPAPRNCAILWESSDQKRWKYQGSISAPTLFSEFNQERRSA